MSKDTKARRGLRLLKKGEWPGDAYLVCVEDENGVMYAGQMIRLDKHSYGQEITITNGRAQYKILNWTKGWVLESEEE